MCLEMCDMYYVLSLVTVFVIKVRFNFGWLHVGLTQHKLILLHFIFIAVNIPLRDYQFAITKKALFSNTLVALPTGLGKTLIAAVVMYNYFRWFPDGNLIIIFLLNHTFHDFFITWLHNFSVLKGIFLQGKNC